MNHETKRDVLKDIVDTLHVMDGAPDDYCKKLLDRYDAALPDDMPVIPEAVGEYIIEAKTGHNGIGLVLMIGGHVMTSNRIAFEEWLTRANSYSDRIDRENTFARAWVLGAWRVEETGEIVKSEE